MSDPQGPDNSAGDPDTAGDPASHLVPGNWLLDDFMQARAMAPFLGIEARLDAFAAAYGEPTDDTPDDGGVRVSWGTKDGDPDTPPASSSGGAPQPGSEQDPAGPGPVQPAAALAQPGAGPPQPPLESAPADAEPGGKSLWSAAVNATQSAATDFYNKSILKPIDDIRQLWGEFKSDPLDTISSITDSFPGTKIEGGLATAALGGLASAKAGSIQTLSALRRYLGSAGTDMQWHHIVEQSQIPQFGPKAIHDIKNVVAIPKEIHEAISAIYSSKTWFTGDLTVRKWLNGKSFVEQYEFGIQQLAKLLGYQSE